MQLILCCMLESWSGWLKHCLNSKPDSLYHLISSPFIQQPALFHKAPLRRDSSINFEAPSLNIVECPFATQRPFCKAKVLGISDYWVLGVGHYVPPLPTKAQGASYKRKETYKNRRMGPSPLKYCLLETVLPLQLWNQQLWLPSQQPALQHFIMEWGGTLKVPPLQGESLTVRVTGEEEKMWPVMWPLAS